jgi:hypothetical protein
MKLRLKENVLCSLMIKKVISNFDALLPVEEKRNLSIFDDIFILQTSFGKNISPRQEKHMIFCQVYLLTINISIFLLRYNAM